MEDIIKIARDMLDLAYAPYSGFKVGCVLVGQNGEIFRGCNIENISFPVTACAERVALFSAIAKGQKKFTKLVVTSSSNEFITPCGVCRQALSEWVEDDFPILLVTNEGNEKVITFKDLLPNQFATDQVGGQ